MKKVLSILIILVLGVLLILPNIKEKEIELEIESIEDNIKNGPQISIYLKGDSGSETTSDTVPDGYGIIKEDSYCYTTDKNNKTYNLVDYDPSSKTLKLSNTVNDNTKCILYFKKGVSPGNVSSLLQGKSIDTTNFDNRYSTLTIDTEYHPGVLFQSQDNDDMSYFYRGQAKDNWLVFAGRRWRIIRINGDGSIRIIYQCGTTDCKTETGEDTNPIKNVYILGSGVGGFYASSITSAIKTWYNGTTGIPEASRKYIDINQGFCCDEEPTNDYGDYGRTSRTFRCFNEEDLYTVKNANRGNKKLDIPVGTITEGEATLAGSMWEKGNSSYYLYTGVDYWTMTPPGRGYETIILGKREYDEWSGDLSGALFTVDTYGNTGTDVRYGIRPVINLRADITFKSGTGTIDDPYVVDETK